MMAGRCEIGSGPCTHVLCARSITRRYDANSTAVSGVDAVSLTLNERDRVAIVGKSGAGKSTFARCLSLLDRPDGGEIWVSGVPAWQGGSLAPLRRQVQLVPQDSEAAFNPQFTAVDAVEEPLRYGPSAPAATRRARARDWLDRLRLPRAAADRIARGLSGGERRRVLLARALATSPAVLILDEALTALDAGLAALINHELFELQAEAGFAIVLIGHDLTAARRCDRALIIDHGTLAESGTAAQVFDHPSSMAGHAFASAARRLEGASC